jgi:hypothetical protein
MLPTSQLGSEVVYGVFTTGTNSLTGSAVCAFKMRDILDVFDGSFKAQEKEKMQWLPVSSDKVRPDTLLLTSTPNPTSFDRQSRTRKYNGAIIPSMSILTIFQVPKCTAPILFVTNSLFRLRSCLFLQARIYRVHVHFIPNMNNFCLKLK